MLTDPVTGGPLGPTDQRSQIKTFNIAPTWTRLIGTTRYLLSAALCEGISTTTIRAATRSPICLRTCKVRPSLRIARSPTSAYAPSMSYVKGIHNIKAGSHVISTHFSTENDSIGIVDPTLVPGHSKCLDA